MKTSEDKPLALHCENVSQNQRLAAKNSDESTTWHPA
jgi:tRNA A37 threonylcarbamoyladenosine synthetase subunit TsaC/SUA5/YrdC